MTNHVPQSQYAKRAGMDPMPTVSPQTEEAVMELGLQRALHYLGWTFPKCKRSRSFSPTLDLQPGGVQRQEASRDEARDSRPERRVRVRARGPAHGARRRLPPRRLREGASGPPPRASVAARLRGSAPLRKACFSRRSVRAWSGGAAPPTLCQGVREVVGVGRDHLTGPAGRAVGASFVALRTAAAAWGPCCLRPPPPPIPHRPPPGGQTPN